MAQKVWHVDDVGRMAATLLVMAPDDSFAAGVLALCNTLGAPVPAQRRMTHWEPVVVIDDGWEVAQ